MVTKSLQIVKYIAKFTHRNRGNIDYPYFIINFTKIICSQKKLEHIQLDKFLKSKALR